MSALTDYAKGKPCLIRIPAICSGRDDQTVACHVKLTGYHGTALKMLDWFIAFGCMPCHDAVDRRRFRSQLSQERARIYHLEGMIRTQEYIMDFAPHLVADMVRTA